MKIAAFLTAAVMGALLLSNSSARAQEIGPGTASARTDAASLALPVGVTLVELNRYFKPKGTKRLSHVALPANWGDLGWRYDGSLGFISSTQFAGSHMLYACFVGGQEDMFTSLDFNCEGHQPLPSHNVGYISAIPLEGTVALYRCRIAWRKAHMDSFSPNCDGEVGANNDGVLGYVFM